MSPACRLCGVLLVAAVTMQPTQTQSRTVIRITAERFAFTPSQIVVNAGEEVELRIKSDDTMHGFRVAGTSINLVVPKRGQPEMVTTLRLDTPGRYEFECSRMCGAGHHFMRGVLVVRDGAKKP